MSFIASKAARKFAAGHVGAYEPSDPYYEVVTDDRGRQKRVKRDVPPGLSKGDAKALRKIRRRAHYLDKGMNLCGFRVGWTFWIGIIPGLGDIADATLNYTLVVRPARKLDIPSGLTSHMLFNNAVSAGVGLVPLVGDIALAAWKANWRNANALEEFLAKRGQENLRAAAAGQAPMPHTELPVPTQAVLASHILNNEHVHGVPSGSGAATPVNMHGAQTPVGGAPPIPPRPDELPAKKKGWFSRA